MNSDFVSGDFLELGLLFGGLVLVLLGRERHGVFGILGPLLSGPVFLPSFSFFFPLFSSWGRLGFSSLLPSLGFAGPGLDEAGPCCIMPCFLFLVFLCLVSLPGPASLSLVPSLFSFSLSLSLSLLFLHASVRQLAPNMLVSIIWRVSLVPAAAVTPAPIAFFELLRLECS